MSNEAELIDVRGANDNNVPIEDNLGYHSAPHELADIRILQLNQACDREEKAHLMKKVRAHDVARRENSGARLAVATQLYNLCLPRLTFEVNAAVPLNTSVRQINHQPLRDGIFRAIQHRVMIPRVNQSVKRTLFQCVLHTCKLRYISSYEVSTYGS